MRFDAFSLARNINYCERFFRSLKTKFIHNKKTPPFHNGWRFPIHTTMKKTMKYL